MKRVLVTCDGAASPPSKDFDTILDLRHSGARANVNLSIESPAHALRSGVGPVASDLLKIAAYVYGADQEVSRGGKTDHFGHDWLREFEVHLPVARPHVWDSCRAILSETLNFVSGDRWSFSFTPAERTDQQLPLQIEPTETMGNPDSVCLLSGGLDSLCAAVEAGIQGRRPLLVGHSPAFHVRNRRAALITELRRHFIDWAFPNVSAAISRADSRDPKETTQRTRSFLYAVLGAIFANRLGLTDVFLADNGIVSLNLPINAQLAGTLASRSTHPKFIRLFNRLLRAIFESPPVISNPLMSRTRAETLEVLKSAGLESIIPLTSSCASSRLLRAEQNHCGVCSQCIDRRFAAIAAGLEHEDLPERYVVDIFRDSLEEGDARTMVLSYHGFALQVSGLSAEGLFETYSQLYDCIEPNHARQQEDADGLVDLLHRHADTVLRVTEQKISEHKGQLARRLLAPGCFISLLGVSPPPTADTSTKSTSDGESWHSPDYRSIFWEGEWRDLTPNRARVVQLLDEAAKPLSQAHILEELEIRSSNLYQVFRNCWAWKTLVILPSKGLYTLNTPENH